MERKQRIVLFFGGLAVLAIILLVVMGGAGLGSGSTSVPKYQIMCSGTVEVDLFGIGQPEFDSKPTCQRDSDPCQRFFGVLSFLPSSEEGSVKLLVNNQVVAATNWESTIGENPDFTIKTACLPDPTAVTVAIYNEEGMKTDAQEVSFQ